MPAHTVQTAKKKKKTQKRRLSGDLAEEAREGAHPLRRPHSRSNRNDQSFGTDVFMRHGVTDRNVHQENEPPRRPCGKGGTPRPDEERGQTPAGLPSTKNITARPAPHTNAQLLHFTHKLQKYCKKTLSDSLKILEYGRTL